MRNKQVININGIWHLPEDAYIQLRNQVANTDTLQDHPDMTKYEMATKILTSLMNTGILSPKVEAIIRYEKALQELRQFTVNEGQLTEDDI